MEKIINQILDLPQMLNQKLPKNCFNEMMDNSEGSVSDWTGKIFKVGALVVLVGIVLFSIWLNKKGVTKDDNDKYIPDVLEDKVKNVKTKVKDIKNIVKKKK